MECLTEWMNKQTNRHKLWEDSAIVFCSRFPWKIITGLHLALTRKQGGRAGPDVCLLRGRVYSWARAWMPYLPLPGFILLSSVSKPHFSHLFGEGIEWDHFYLKRRFSARFLVNTHSILAVWRGTRRRCEATEALFGLYFSLTPTHCASKPLVKLWAETVSEGRKAIRV